MKRRILKCAMLSMLFLLTIFSTVQHVHAEKYTGQAIWPSEYISNIYIKKVSPTRTKYQQARFIRRSEDNKFVYCLQPYTDIDNNLPYYDVIREDYANVLNFTEEQWDRISLLAYYGYQYNDNGYNHNDVKWYAITQVMIWRTTNPESDIYYTDSLNGNRITKFEAEMAEMENLISSHYTTPKFQDVTIPVGSTKTISDINNVLSKYKISNTENVTASIDGNNLVITANNVGNGKITFEKKATYYEIPPIVYMSNHSQNVFRVGNYDPVYARLNLKILGGRISISKHDSCGNTPSDASLKGAVYGIYDMNGNKITEITTDESGNATSDYLPSLGRYYIQEIKASNNYLLDKTKYEVELTEENTKDNIPVHIDVKENRKAKISLIKKDSKTGTPQGEATLKGAVYDIFDMNGNRVGSMTTDENGTSLSGYLPSTGEYTIKEVKASNGYNIDRNIYTIIVEEDNTCLPIEVESKEVVITNTYEFTKLYAKADTGFMTPEINVKFAIYNNKNEKITEFITDSNGKFKTTLPYGTYTLKQLTSTPGYNKMDDYIFTINKQIDDVIYKNIANSEIVAKLRVVKIDSETKEVIQRSNIKFKIFDIKNNEYVCQTVTYPNKKTYCEFETDENGEFTTPYELHSGSYKLEEVDQKIDGYLWNQESHEFTIDDYSNLRTDSEYGIIFDTVFENTAVKGKVEIKKTGEVAIITEDGFEFDSKPLEGVTFGIFAKDNIVYNGKVVIKANTKIEESKTDKDGNLTFDKLYLGKYYIKELSTLDDYVLDENEYEFELLYQDQYTPVIIYSKSILNILKTGKLEFTKTDISESKTLPNTKIEIYNDSDQLIYSGITDENGKIVIDRIPVGKYYIIESEAPEGYKLNEEKMYFEIKENGEVIKSTMKDDDITGTLEFTKVDFSTDEGLPNTLIEIYDANTDELIYSGRTDEEGKITIDKIKYGKYYILEKEAPEGYTLNEERMYFEIKEDGEIVKSIMKDERIIEVPNTGIDDKNNNTVVAIILVLIGVGAIIYGNVKRKKK